MNPFKLFFWYKNFGICFYGPASFARYKDEEHFYGPYELWFERKLWPFYWAQTPPTNDFGILQL